MAERKGLLTPCTYCGRTAYRHSLKGLTFTCIDGDERTDFYTVCDGFDMRTVLKLKFTPKMRDDMRRAECVTSMKEFIL